MLSFLTTRLVAGVAVILAASSAAFVLAHLAGANVARNLLRENATDAEVAAKASELGLDRPLVVQYADWFAGVLQGDLGTSWFTNQPVAPLLASRLPVTLSLVFVAILVAAVVAFVLGIGAAMKRGWLDKALQVISVAGAAIPDFVVALLLVVVFALQLGWFPATGFIPFTRSPQGWITSIVLPVTALVIAAVSSIAQQVRSAVIATMRKDFVRTLKSRNLSAGEIIFRNVLRDAAPTGLTILSLRFIALLGGAVVIERVFALPGIGTLAVDASMTGDMPIMVGVVVYLVVIVVIVNLLVDLIVGWLNPKSRAA